MSTFLYVSESQPDIQKRKGLLSIISIPQMPFLDCKHIPEYFHKVYPKKESWNIWKS